MTVPYPVPDELTLTHAAARASPGYLFAAAMTTPLSSPAYLPMPSGRIPRPHAAVVAALLGTALSASALVLAGDVWSPFSASHQLLKLGWLVTVAAGFGRSCEELLAVRG
jgi:hypothetical protein